MVQLIDWPTGPQLVAVTIRRGSTVSVTETAWAVLKVPVLVTSRVKVWLPSPAVAEEGRKVLTRLRVTSLVTVVVLDEALLPGTGSAVGLNAVAALLIVEPPGVAGSTVVVMTTVWTWPGVMVPSAKVPGQAPTCGTVSSVQLDPPSALGRLSVRLTAAASEG